MISQQKFPKHFLWGASTASHQVEGGTVNQWSVWELEHAADLAAGAEQRLAKTTTIVKSADWQEIKPLATDPENYVSGAGVDHYNRYEEDFDLLEELNFNAFRFGIEWSRIEPEEGAWDPEAIRHYHDYIDSLNHRGITPLLNIWHWTMPTWFTDRGGFEKKENIVLFEEFVAKVADEYGDKLKYVITLNEPNVYSSFSYFSGEWPPQRKNPKLMFTVYRNLVEAHKRAYRILKDVNPSLQVGVAAQLGNIQAKRPHNLFDGIMTKVMRYAWNWWFLNRIRRYQDFVGINYYFTDYYHGLNGKDSPHVPSNDLGWYMEPEGLYPLLLRTWARYKKPIIITENGVADRKDQYRQWWLEQTVIAMQRAMSEGVDLRGYMHWSLLDNFEWAYGWWPKFGLVEVDRERGMKRTPRPSALWFAEQLAAMQGRGGAVAKPAPRAHGHAGVHAGTRDTRPPKAPVAAPATVARPADEDDIEPAPRPRRTVRPMPKADAAAPRAGGRGQAPAASDQARPTRALAGVSSRLRPTAPPQRPASERGSQPAANRMPPEKPPGQLDLSRLRRRIQ